MQPSNPKSSGPERNTEAAEASLSKNEAYRIEYASDRVAKKFRKAYEKMPASDVQAIKQKIKKLATDPRQKGRKLHAVEVLDGMHLAQFRLRVGNFRVFYDVNDETRTVILLVVARRNERTYG